jgi:hypothetical protein
MERDALLEALAGAKLERTKAAIAEGDVRLALPSLAELAGWTIHRHPPGRPEAEWPRGCAIVAHPKSHVPDEVNFANTGCTLLIGRGSTLRKCSVQFHGRGALVAIGADTHLTQCILYATHARCTVAIGSGVTWVGGLAQAFEADMTVLIGDGVLMSSEIIVRTSDGHPIFDRGTGERINPPSPVCIQEDVWVGRNVRIGKGVTVGRGGIVGQGSLVTKSTAPHSLNAGIPARLIRENVEWRRSLKVNAVPPTA